MRAWPKHLWRRLFCYVTLDLVMGNQRRQIQAVGERNQSWVEGDESETAHLSQSFPFPTVNTVVLIIIRSCWWSIEHFMLVQFIVGDQSMLLRSPVGRPDSWLKPSTLTRTCPQAYESWQSGSLFTWVIFFVDFTDWVLSSNGPPTCSNGRLIRQTSTW